MCPFARVPFWVPHFEQPYRSLIYSDGLMDETVGGWVSGKTASRTTVGTRACHQWMSVI